MQGNIFSFLVNLVKNRMSTFVVETWQPCNMFFFFDEQTLLWTLPANEGLAMVSNGSLGLIWSVLHQETS